MGGNILLDTGKLIRFSFETEMPEPITFLTSSGNFVLGVRDIL